MARQPIFDERKKVYAYELLFRSGLENFFQFSDGDQATSRVLTDSFLLFGIEELTGQSRAFINFTHKLLASGLGLALPKDLVVIEVLETVTPDERIVSSCRRLKKAGFILALDDFVYQPEFEPLLELADIVKVDFRLSGESERKEIAEEMLKRGIRMLAEKVETDQEYEEAKSRGYTLFQGYFFARPTVVKSGDVPPSKLHQLRLLSELNLPDIDFSRLAQVISEDASTAFKLLNYINSAAFGVRNEITSVKQAITLLGQTEVRNWASLLAMGGLATDKPAELTRAAAVRAKMAELCAGAGNLASRKKDAFLLGLFSLLDTMMGRPMEELMARLPLPEEMRGALLKRPGPLADLLKLVVAQERGLWDDLFESARSLGVPTHQVPDFFVQAVEFTEKALNH